MLDNVLFLSPHCDDECLGAGGTLLQCDLLHIFYFNFKHPLVDFMEYVAEAENVRENLGCNTSYSNYPDVNKLNEHPLVNYITEIENKINTFKPTTLMIPVRSRNQDHQVVYDAAMVACRPHDTNWYVPNVLLYEQHEYVESDFIPQIFVPIDIEEKLNLFSLYMSQQRGHRKPEHIRHLAGLRGSQCNQEYAEAFMVVRQTL